MSNYKPTDNDQGNRRQPRDTSQMPEDPVVDVNGNITSFGDEDSFQDPMSLFKEEIKNKFYNIWKKTFK